MTTSAELDFIGRCSTPWEVTQGAATWLAQRCAAAVSAIYLDEGGTGQVRRGLHVPGEGALAPLTTLLPHRLWWKGPAAWTSAAGPSMRIVPFSLGRDGGVAVVGPFDAGPSRESVGQLVDAEVRGLAAPLAAGLERFPAARPGRSDLLEAVAYQYGASLDGSPDPLLYALRERLQARRVAWEDGRLVVEDPTRQAPAALAAAEWWLPLIGAGGAGRLSDADAGISLVLLGLADVLDARHPATTGRSLATAELAIRLGSRHGLGGQDLATVEEAAGLHRIGTALIEVDPMAAEDPLPHRMTRVGACLLAGAGRPAAVVGAVRHLSERWDGTGPAGLHGTEIPPAARVVAVAAAWLDLTSAARARAQGPGPLPSAGQLVERRAARNLVARAGSDLDPRVVGALLEETDASAAL